MKQTLLAALVATLFAGCASPGTVASVPAPITPANSQISPLGFNGGGPHTAVTPSPSPILPMGFNGGGTH